MKVLDEVKILPLDAVGIIIGIWIDFGGTSYKVRYFWQGVSHEVYFYEKELIKI